MARANNWSHREMIKSGEFHMAIENEFKHMKEKQSLWLIFAAALVVYILGLFPEVGIDSAKYAAVSRSMYETGDWLQPYIYGKPYLQKPPFMFWLSSLSFHIFGLSMFAFKLPSLLFTIASIFALYKFVKVYYSAKVAWVSALIYSTSQMLFLYSNDLHTDALLTANVVLGVSFIGQYLRNKKLGSFLLGFLFVGFATLTKGPLGLAVAGFAVGGHLVMTKNWKMLFSPIWLLGAVIVTIVLLPTLISNYNHFGWEGIQFFFWTNNAGRMAGSHGMNKDYFFYIHTMAYIFLPWSGFAFVMFFNHIKNLIKKGKAAIQRSEYFSYSLIIVFGTIISLSGQKAPHYMFSIIPFLSILVADYVVKVFDKHKAGQIKSLFISQYILLGISVAASFFVIIYVFPTFNISIWIAVVAILATIIFIYIKEKEVFSKLVLPLALVSIMLNFIINVQFMPSVFQYHGAIRACDKYSELAKDNEVLYTYKYKQFETYFYAKNISQRVFDKEELEQMQSRNNFWLITSEEGKHEVDSIFSGREDKVEVFKHKKISQLGFKFLNPKTRESSLKNVYLVKID